MTNVTKTLIEDDLMIFGVLKQREGWTGNLVQRHDLKTNKFWDD